MRQPVFVHVQETYETHHGPKNNQLLTEGVLIREPHLIRIEYRGTGEAGGGPAQASIMKAEGFWHITRPGRGEDLITICPGGICSNSYTTDHGVYEMDVMPDTLIWEEEENGGNVQVECRLARGGRPYRSYTLSVQYTTCS